MQRLLNVVLALPFLVALAPLAGCAGQTFGARAPREGVPILPLKSVRLYETGVGYFERQGIAAGRTSLPVPAGHLDDALKTLVVLSKDGKAKVTGLSFPSSVSPGMARALAGLPLEAGSAIGYKDLLASMRGAHVVVSRKDGASTTGRLVDVLEPKPAPEPPRKPKPSSEGDRAEAKGEAPELTVLLLTDEGAVVHLGASAITSVRPTDPAFAGRLASALDAVSTQGARSERLLQVLGDDREPVTLGYLAEAPIWRTTYRMVLGDDGKSALQGWALLHNDTDEDWKSVHVELVNGQPDSFLFPLAAPRYARRELVTPQSNASTVPQLLDNSADRMWGDHIDDASGAGGMGLSGVGEGGGGRGEGIGLGSIGTIGHGSGTGTASGTSSLLEVGNLARTDNAQGIEGGALFRYVLTSGLDLGARSSALVPFLQAPTEALPITYFASPTAGARSAVRFVNATKQTLPPGTVAFYADGGFAGEAAIDRMKPGERRFVEFGRDLDVELETKNQKSVESTQRLKVVGAQLQEHFLRTTKFAFVIKNESGRPRSVVVGLQVATNGRIEGADRVDFDAAHDRPLAVFALAPKKSVARDMTTIEGLSRSFSLSHISVAELEKLSQTATLSAFERQILGEALTRARAAEAARKSLEKAKAEITTDDQELGRLRENLKTLAGEKDKAHPFVVRVVAAEDRLAKAKLALRASELDLQQKVDALRTTLEKLKEP